MPKVAPKRHQVNVRLNETEYATLKARADARGLDLSDYVRGRALAPEDDGAGLAARVEELAAKLDRYAEMAEQYDNLAALLADPRWRPTTD